MEAYTTSLQVDVFVTHELIHALHYTYRPEFYFTDEHTKNLLGRQVITEGLATWGTMKVMGVDAIKALWADYVSPEFARRWYEQCQHREREMAQRVLSEWQESQKTNECFTMWDESDVTKYRGGYYIGLQVTRRLHQKHNMELRVLLRFEPKSLEELALTVLEEIAANNSA